jgi:hypothetical protein
MFGKPQNVVTVNRADDGTITVNVPDNDYYGLSIVRALKSRVNMLNGQLTSTADALIAAKAAASTPVEGDAPVTETTTKN